jgi:ABC-2 type transport system ATP-binding protein
LNRAETGFASNCPFHRSPAEKRESMTTAESETVIAARDLHGRYGRTEALGGVSFSVARGEMISIVGPDGAGKTTLLKILCGLVKPYAGTASILGYDLRKELKHIRRRIGYLSQGFSLYGDLSVDENIDFFAGIYRAKDYRQQREELLRLTRLGPFRKRLAEHLSGGMKKKLALACTLIHHPSVIFLDEPTTGVDPVSRRDFWTLLARFQRSGITILLTTPYLDEAERSSRVGMLSNGKLLIMDVPDAIRRTMKGYVLEIVVDQTRKAFSILKKTPHVGEVQLFGDRLNVIVREKERGFEFIQHSLEREGIAVVELRAVSPSLENAFISLMKDHRGTS